MNGPCSLCNHYHNEIRLAIARHEYTRIAWLEDQQYKHRQECETINSLWYHNLWIGAEVIVIDNAALDRGRGER